MMASLSVEQLEDLQTFVKDWLRHCGRTQADLRRALRAASIRMPVLLEELDRIHSQQGLTGLVGRLCDIEALWCSEDVGSGEFSSGPVSPFTDSLEQLDLLLEEIRQERQL